MLSGFTTKEHAEQLKRIRTKREAYERAKELLKLYFKEPKNDKR